MEPSRPRRLTRRLALLGLLAVLLTLAASCGSVGYVTQSAWGGLRLMAKREPIDRLLRRNALEAEERAALEDVLRMRDFATERLSLPDNKSYRTYVDVGRPWVTWTVTAAPELSVDPVVWCFPVAGCVSYRGYFKQEKAERFAARLEREGLDVATGPVAAFSTLGWFADPVLSTFLRRREADLAGLVFHELAHQVVYVKGDTTFNESFASAVEKLGQRLWLEAEGRPEEMDVLLAENRTAERFAELVLAARAELRSLFAEEVDRDTLLARKAKAYERLRAAYERSHAEWDPQRRYASWFERDLNNAHLVQVGSYTTHVPAFEALFVQSGASFERFYEAVRELAALPARAREEKLLELAAPSSAQARSTAIEAPGPSGPESR